MIGVSRRNAVCLSREILGADRQGARGSIQSIHMDVVAFVMHSDMPVGVGGLAVLLAAIRTLEPRLFAALVPKMRQHVALLAECTATPWAGVSLFVYLLLLYHVTRVRPWKRQTDRDRGQ